MPRLIEQFRVVPREIKGLPRSIKRISLLVFIYYLSWGVVNPFMPVFFHDVLGSYTKTTFIGAALFLFGLIWLFPIGELLNSISKKKVMKAALILYLPLWPFLAWAQVLWHFVLYQFYHSMVAMSFWSSAETYTRLNSPPNKKTESWGFFDVGAVFATLLGAIIGAIMLERFMDIRTLFLTLPVLFTLIAIFYTRYIPEDDGHQGFMSKAKEINWKGVYLQQIKDFISVPDLKRLIFFIFAAGFLGRSLMYLLPLVSDSMGASFLHIGILMALFAVPVLLEVPFSVLADLWSKRLIIAIGFLISSVTLLGIAFIDNPSSLLPLGLFLGLSLAMISPTISGAASDVMPRERTGGMNAVYSANFTLGGIIGLLVLGPLADMLGMSITFIIGAAFMVTCSFLAMLFIKD